MANPVYPCLWYDNQAHEAAVFYCSVFQNSAITAETPMVVCFELEGLKFMGLNGGPLFEFNQSVSFFVSCSSEKEVLYYWEKLCADGRVLIPLDRYDWSGKYGWCADKYGLTWQIYLNSTGTVSQKIVPLFLFSNLQYGNAEKAVNYYNSLFENSEIQGIIRYGKDAPQPEGLVMHSQFTLNGRIFMAMDGPGDKHLDFNEAVSFVLECGTQNEIDFYWDSLTKEGREGMCGWCKDPFGVSWQIIPGQLRELMANPSKAGKVTEAFLKMKKFDIETLMKI